MAAKAGARARLLQKAISGALRIGEGSREVGLEALAGGTHAVPRAIDRDRLRADGRRVGGRGVKQGPQSLVGASHLVRERPNGGLELLLQPTERHLLGRSEVERPGQALGLMPGQAIDAVAVERRSAGESASVRSAFGEDGRDRQGGE